METWEKDYETIHAVMNILPDKLEEIINQGKFNKDLLVKVPGGYYEVPIYYVTKAWEYFIKPGNCGRFRYFASVYYFESEEYDSLDTTDEEIVIEEWNRMYSKESIEVYGEKRRTFYQAYQDNKKIKEIWKSKFNIDIDALEIDFSLFNRMLPPQIDEYDSFAYFVKPPESKDGYFVYPIIDVYPYFICSYGIEIEKDNVSTLMELLAFSLQDDKEDMDDEYIYSPNSVNCNVLEE